jgi:hypothetical protein
MPATASLPAAINVSFYLQTPYETDFSETYSSYLMGPLNIM